MRPEKSTHNVSTFHLTEDLFPRRVVHYCANGLNQYPKCGCGHFKGIIKRSDVEQVTASCASGCGFWT